MGHKYPKVFLKAFLQNKHQPDKHRAKFNPQKNILTRKQTIKKRRRQMKKTVLSPNAPKPIGPYSQAVQAGKFVFVSGQLAINPKEGKIVEGGIVLQTRQVMENIKAILEAAGYTLQDIIHSTVYLSSMALFDEFNREYAKFFEADYPARATVAAELKAGALVEVSVVAYRE
jgi:2-iminobutanoate/2-iminopropanoate deaminase